MDRPRIPLNFRLDRATKGTSAATAMLAFCLAVGSALADDPQTTGIETGCEDNCFDLPDVEVFARRQALSRSELAEACNKLAVVKRKKYDYCVYFDYIPSKPITPINGTTEEISCVLLEPGWLHSRKEVADIYQRAYAECQRTANHYLKYKGLIAGATQKSKTKPTR